MTRRKHLFLALLVLFFSAELNAQTQTLGQNTDARVITTAVPFLLITPDARAAAMGDVGVATSPDANALHWNVGKIAFNDRNYGFGVSFTPWLGKIINDMSISYLSGFKKLTEDQAIALDVRYFDLGDILLTDDRGEELGQFNPREFAISGAYSRKLSENFGIGVGMRFIHSNLSGNLTTSSGGDTKAGVSFAADLGVYYKKSVAVKGNRSEVAFGANISNIGAKLTYNSAENKDFIPTNLRIGTSLRAALDRYNSITFAVDLNKLMVPTPPIYAVDADGAIQVDANGNPVIESGKDPNRSLFSGMFGSFGDAPDGFGEELKEFTIGAGVEYWYRDVFAVRGGYFLENEQKGNRKYLTMGVGLRYQVFGLDFAYLVPSEKQHPLAETLRFSLVFNFDQNGNRSSGDQ